MTTSDVERLECGLRDDLDKRSTVMTAMQTFLANQGKVFDKIAGIDGEISRASLQKALEKDEQLKSDHQDGLFSDDARQQVQWMADNWYHPAVKQLREGNWSMFQPSKRLYASFGGFASGLQNGFGSNFQGMWRPINWAAGLVDGVGEGLWGLVTGDKIESHLNRDAMEQAVETNFGSADNASNLET